MEDLKNYILYKCNARGKVTNCMEALGKALLTMWALQNTSGKAMTIIKEEDTDKIVMIVLGRGKDFPKVIKEPEQIEAMGIVIEEV